jgi:hypothetical protein
MEKRKRRRKKKTKKKKERNEFGWCKEFWMFACLIIVPVGLLGTILFIVILGIMKGIMKEQRGMITYVTRSQIPMESRREINEFYLDKEMMDQTKTPCIDFHSYACNNAPKFNKNGVEQMEYLLSIANYTMTKTNKAYKWCIDFEERNFKGDQFLSMGLWNPYSVHRLLKLIDGQDNNHVIMYLMEHSVNLRFGMNIIESPLTLSLNTRESVVFLYHSNQIKVPVYEKIYKYFPNGLFSEERVNKINQLINTLIIESRPLYDGTCFVDFKAFNNALCGDLDMHYIESPYCVSSIHFFDQLFHKKDYLECWKDYAKYAVLDTVSSFLHERELNEDKKEQFCLSKTILHFPELYCDTVKKQIYGYEETILPSINEFSSYLLRFFIEQIEHYWKDYGLECMDKNVIEDLKKLKIEVGGCISSDRSANKTSFFDTESNYDPFSHDVNTSLTVKHPYYLKGRHKIVIPFMSIIEPAYSMLYKNETLFGTLGFALAHEMFHCLIHMLRNHKMSCFAVQIKDIESTYDVLAMELISKIVEEYEVLFPTTGQYICHQIEDKQVWEGKTSKGYSTPKDRLDYLMNNLIGHSKEEFNKQYSC